MRIICMQTILMKHQALFYIFEKAAKFDSDQSAFDFLPNLIRVSVVC